MLDGVLLSIANRVAPTIAVNDFTVMADPRGVCWFDHLDSTLGIKRTPLFRFCRTVVLSMTIDIDKLDEEDLIALNHRVVERLRFLRQVRAHHAMLAFRIGELVSFNSDDHGRIRGVVTKYNKKSVSVLTPDGQQWRVAPSLLRKEVGQAQKSTKAERAAAYSLPKDE